MKSYFYILFHVLYKSHTNYFYNYTIIVLKKNFFGSYKFFVFKILQYLLGFAYFSFFFLTQNSLPRFNINDFQTAEIDF